MANLNRVLLMGNLTRDVELRYTASNQPVAKIGLAVNRNYTTKDGERREETTFVDCEAWGRQAETMQKYLAKGRPVFIEGRLKLDQWEDRDGQKRSKLLVSVENFQFVGSRGDQGGGGDRSEGQGGGEYRREPVNAGGGGRDVPPDDIPF